MCTRKKDVEELSCGFEDKYKVRINHVENMYYRYHI